MNNNNHSILLSGDVSKTLEERWISIVSYKDYTFDGKYEVSSLGNIRNTKTKKPLATHSNQRGKGYLKTKITDIDGNRHSIYLHQLVAYYFVGKNKSRFIDVDHIDNNPHNNTATNLQYLSHRDNCRKIYKDRVKNGTNSII